MTLQAAYNFFESLNANTINASEIKIYKKFLYILTELESREFSKEEIKSIEAELENLNLESNPENRKRYFKNALGNFEKYLKNILSLTPKRYYTRMGIGLGSSFGILFGIIFLTSFNRSLGITLGVGVGMIIGLIIGRSMDAKAINEGRVL